MLVVTPEDREEVQGRVGRNLRGAVGVELAGDADRLVERDAEVVDPGAQPVSRAQRGASDVENTAAVEQRSDRG